MPSRTPLVILLLAGVVSVRATPFSVSLPMESSESAAWYYEGTSSTSYTFEPSQSYLGGLYDPATRQLDLDGFLTYPGFGRLDLSGDFTFDPPSESYKGYFDYEFSSLHGTLGDAVGTLYFFNETANSPNYLIHGTDSYTLNLWGRNWWIQTTGMDGNTSSTETPIGLWLHAPLEPDSRVPDSGPTWIFMVTTLGLLWLASLHQHTPQLARCLSDHKP